MPIASTLSGFFTNTLEVKNNGSLINLNPLSLLCCALYSHNTSRSVNMLLSNIFVANINLPALIFSASIADSFGSIFPVT